MAATTRDEVAFRKTLVSKLDLTDFTALLRRVVDQFPTHKAMAEAIGISPTRLSHALNETGGYAFSLENCLRLAKIAKVSPLEVLRAAKKDEEAALLSFFAISSAGLDTAERDLIELWRTRLDQEDRDEARRSLENLAKLRARLRALISGNTPLDAAAPHATPRKAGRRPRPR